MTLDTIENRQDIYEGKPLWQVFKEEKARLNWEGPDCILGIGIAIGSRRYSSTEITNGWEDLFDKDAERYSAINS